jgi:DNA-3-methyladenine glycosylase II
VIDMSARILTHLSAIDPNMGGLIRAVGPYALVLESESHPFEALAQAIAHQQLHGAAARTILARFVTNIGQGAFPTPQAVIAAPETMLRQVGFSGSKIAALRDLANKTLAGIVPDREALDRLEDAEIITRLTEVRGIGRWTVEMLLMFHLGRPDILPVDDFGVRAGFQFTYGLRKMPAPKALALYGERWGPYRSAAAWYLWRAVELKRAGKLPEPLERIRMPRLLKARRKKAATAASKKRTSNAAGASRTRVGAGALPRSTGRKTPGSAVPNRSRPDRPTKAKPKRAYR